ncbi:DNA repair protein RadC [Jannaschia faecimaris]|uniref:DNA repair protein RadC n=1 Tax=Jannaschia faecimaris TaxID=1244108 RepID=A0A1H3J205_9RHOB|nr:DNA repair protein RadC [Jannaschia faecimaris]SDY33976.1 DNA repair protein RadC [Jannaschia faecimaris]
MTRPTSDATHGIAGSFSEASPIDLFGSVTPVPARAVPPSAGTGNELDSRLAHRARLRQRFMQGGAAAMPDYELLELLLFRALPRGDVKPLAKRLLCTFGDLNSVMAAPADRLAEVKGAGQAVVEQLKILEALGHRMARAKVIERPILSSWDALLDYLKTALAHQGTERFRVLYLDRKNVLIADQELAEGTVDHVPVYPREVVKRALALNASALILVHNHPSGDPTPSEADIAMTIAIRDAAALLGIMLHDHLVIGKGAEVSFRAEGLI